MRSPDLRELLRRIAAQESRHYSFYVLQVEWRLAASRLARGVVASLMRKTWTPVGVGDGYKAPAEFDRVLDRPVPRRRGRASGGPHGPDDRLRFPGLDGINLFRRAMDASRARTDPSGVAA